MSLTPELPSDSVQPPGSPGLPACDPPDMFGVEESAIPIDVVTALTIMGSHDPDADVSGVQYAIDFSDLAYVSLTDLDLQRLSAGSTNFTWANLTDSRFHDGDFVNAQFPCATLTGANFTDTNLFLASLDAATLTDANFTDANLFLASFDAANLNDAKFNRANLSHSNFTNADLAGADFSGADLSGACPIDVELSGAIGLTEAQIDSAITSADELEATETPPGFRCGR